MTGHAFSLVPFPAPAIPNINITGRVSIQNNVLAVHYLLAGNLDGIVLPSASTDPGRKNDLWKSTCFEFFIAFKDRPQYWEFNMSPSGDWNVYRMDAYRRMGFREEASIQQLPFDVQRDDDALTLNATIDLTPLAERSDDLEIGITAVTQSRDGSENYWALAHPAPQADFHLRESFILSLAAQIHPSGQSAPGG